MEKAQPNSHSTLAKGSQIPHPDHDDKIGDARVPAGPPKPSGIKGTAFQHNEYVVYDKAQVRIKYLLKVKIN
jgi:hypothetical protein